MAGAGSQGGGGAWCDSLEVWVAECVLCQLCTSGVVILGKGKAAVELWLLLAHNHVHVLQAWRAERGARPGEAGCVPEYAGRCG